MKRNPQIKLKGTKKNSQTNKKKIIILMND